MHTNESPTNAVLANPDLPTSFIEECLKSMVEPREHSTPFVPRSLPHHDDETTQA